MVVDVEEGREIGRMSGCSGVREPLPLPATEDALCFVLPVVTVVRREARSFDEMNGMAFFT